MKSLRNIKFGFTNLFRWFKIIWNDRDWDQYFFHLIMKKKLEHMRDYHLNYGQCENSNLIAQKINTAIKLLDKILKDDFTDREFFKNVKYNWEELPEVDENGEHYLTVKRISNHTDEEIRNKWKQADELEKKTYRTFYHFLEKRIKWFWD